MARRGARASARRGWTARGGVDRATSHAGALLLLLGAACGAGAAACGADGAGAAADGRDAGQPSGAADGASTTHDGGASTTHDGGRADGATGDGARADATGDAGAPAADGGAPPPGRACHAGPFVDPHVPRLTSLVACDAAATPFTALAVDGADVFAAAGDTLVRVPTTGGAPSPVARLDGALFSALVADATALHALATVTAGATSHAALWRVERAGGAARELYAPAGALTGLWGLAQDDDALYVSEADVHAEGRPGAIVRVDKATGVAAPLAAGLTWPRELVPDGASLLVASWGVGVLRVAKADGAVSVVAADTGRLGGVATDGASVFWLDRGSFPEERDGALRRAPAQGGEAAMLAPVVRPGGALALWGGALYTFAGALERPGDPGLDPRLLRVDPASGATVELTSPLLTQLGPPVGLAPAPDALYWAEPTALRRLRP